MTVQQPTLSQIVGAVLANGQILIANTTATGGSNVHSDANLVFDYANGQLTITHANANATYNIAVFQGAAAGAAQNQNSEWVTIATRSNSAAALSFCGNGAIFASNDFWIGADWTSIGYIAQRGANDLVIETNGTERIRANAQGYLFFSSTGGVGSGGPLVPPQYFGGQPGYFFAGNGNKCFPCFARYEATPFGVSIGLYKSRNATIGLQTAAVNGDNPGDIVWLATDGTTTIPCARIMATHDSAVSTNTIPTALGLFTTTANTPTENWRLTSQGQITQGGTAGNVTAAGGLNHQYTIVFAGQGTLYGLGMVANSTASNTHYISFANAATSTLLGQISANTTTTVGLFAISDHRLKSNVANLENGISIIMGMQPRTFDWHTGEKGIGFIAHELQEALPVGSHAVTGHKNAVDANGIPVHQMVDLSQVVPHLVAAIQDQQRMIIDLQKEIKALKSNN